MTGETILCHLLLLHQRRDELGLIVRVVFCIEIKRVRDVRRDQNFYLGFLLSVLRCWQRARLWGHNIHNSGYLLMVQAVQIQGVIDVTTKQKLRREDVYGA